MFKFFPSCQRETRALLGPSGRAKWWARRFLSMASADPLSTEHNRRGGRHREGRGLVQGPIAAEWPKTYANLGCFHSIPNVSNTSALLLRTDRAVTHERTLGPDDTVEPCLVLPHMTVPSI